jgi:pSer/pThr/pTyr-binding forkhead associated (FHA) protein
MAQGNASLKVLRGDDQGKSWALHEGEVYVLGRSRKCNLRLTDGTVSSAHARMECEQGLWRITDLKSFHGTQVNDQRILGAKPILDRDLIRAGKSLLQFREYEELDPADLAEVDNGVTLRG